MNPDLTGHTVQVHYKDGPVRLEVGPAATAVHIARHVATVRYLRRFEGPLGWARKLLYTVRARLRGMPGFGSADFEARLEVQKLRAIERDLLAAQRQLEQRAERDRDAATAGALDADATHRLERELTDIQEQLEYHATRLDTHTAGTGHVAAHGDIDYAVSTKDLIVSEPVLRSGQWFVEIAAPMPEGNSQTIIASVYIPVDGSPPHTSLQNSTYTGGKYYKVRLVERGEALPLTTYAIRFAERLYKEKIGGEMNEIGGSLGMDNLTNFQRAYLAARENKVKHEDALLLAARSISYGRRRIEAGYTELEVRVKGDLIDDVYRTDLGPEYATSVSKTKVPSGITIIGRKPGGTR